MVWRWRRDLGLLDGITAYYFGNMEEWCDGIAPNSFVEADPKVRPDFVVIGEPTKMHIYRGHKGRFEMKIVADGKSAHAAHHHLGDNAVYKMVNIIQAIRELDRRLGHTSCPSVPRQANDRGDARRSADGVAECRAG